MRGQCPPGGQGEGWGTSGSIPLRRTSRLHLCGLPPGSSQGCSGDPWFPAGTTQSWKESEGPVLVRGAGQLRAGGRLCLLWADVL